MAAAAVYLLVRLHYLNYFQGSKELAELNNENIGERNPELSSFCVIAHAGGALNGIPYLNTLEAIENTYSIDVDYIELDFHYTKDSVIVLSHDFVAAMAADFLGDTASGTPLSLTMFMDWLSDKQVKIVTDIKENNLEVLHMIRQVFPTQADKLIPQAYSIREIIEIKKLGYKDIIYTNYKAQYPNPIIRQLLQTNTLFAVTLPYDNNFKLFRMFDGLKDYKTSIFVHTINDRDVRNQLRADGCDGIYTDTLLKPD